MGIKNSKQSVNISTIPKKDFKAKERMFERNETIKRLAAEKEMKGARLAGLKSEETEDMKRLEEIGMAKMELEREEHEIRRRVRERDIEVMVVKQALDENARKEVRQKAELKKEVEAVKELDKSMKEMMKSPPATADAAQN